MRMMTKQIVILISSDYEWRTIKNVLPVVRESKTPFGEQCMARLGQRELIFFHGGWGKIAAAASTQYVVCHMNPQLLVNIGTCGSFHSSMRRGDIILADRTLVYDITEQMGNFEEAINAYTTEIDISWAKDLKGVRRDILISGDRDILRRDAKELHSKYDAMAADWESGAIAWTAKKNDVPVIVLRGVSDVVGETESPAYGDIGHFEEGVGIVMERLLGILPECLNLWELSTNEKQQTIEDRRRIK